MKKRAKVVILVLAVIALAGFASGCDLPDNAVAKVGEVLLSNQDFTQQVEEMASQYGITKENDPDSYREMQEWVIDSMIQTEIAAQKAAGLGLTVTDEEVLAELQSTADLYYEGDLSALEAALQSLGMTMDDLKARYRESLLTQRVYDEVTKEVTSVSDEEISAYYEDAKSDYLTEQTVDARHIFIAVGGGDATGASEGSTTSTTQAADATTTTTEAAASDSTTTTGFSDLDWAGALVTAARVRLDLLGGGDWMHLAGQYSDDEATKASGGELKAVKQGDYADDFGQEFDSALFSLEVDQISEPVKTANGYHIIQITAITEPQQKPLGEVRDDIVAILVDEAQYEAWLQWIEEAKAEIGVVYRKDLRPTTTTTVAPADPAGASTTATAGP